MKKILIFSLMLVVGAKSFAQSLEDIKKMFNSKQLSPAKVAIDKYFSDAKNANNDEIICRTFSLFVGCD